MFFLSSVFHWHFGSVFTRKMFTVELRSDRLLSFQNEAMLEYSSKFVSDIQSKTLQIDGKYIQQKLKTQLTIK